MVTCLPPGSEASRRCLREISIISGAIGGEADNHKVIGADELWDIIGVFITTESGQWGTALYGAAPYKYLHDVNVRLSVQALEL